MPRFCRRFLADHSGATAIEYALIAAFIAVTVAAAITVVGTNTKALFQGATALF